MKKQGVITLEQEVSMDKKKMVDYPEYEPDGRIPFPPEPGEKPEDRPPRQPEAAAKPPYHEAYDPDPRSTDPSQTMPGAPDIRDPATKLPPDTDLSKLSPDVNLDDKYEK